MATQSTTTRTKRKNTDLKEAHPIEQEIRDRVWSAVKLTCIGNSNRKLKDVAVDLIHQSGERYSRIANGALLSTSTIKNLAVEKTLNPQSETIERIFRYFETGVTLTGETIKPKYRNKPKK